MEQIYEKDGVPVKVVSLKARPFKATQIYHAPLTGIMESTANAAFGGRIDKILVKVGDYVKKDQLVMTFPKDAPAARYYQAKAAYETAKKSLQRIKKLYAKGGVSDQSLDNVQAQYDVAEANWQAVSESVEVKAPISGYVTRISVSESDNVAKKAELLSVAQTNKLKAVIRVSENEICDFKEGLAARARWKGRVLSGKVTRVDKSMNIRSQSFGVQLVFENQTDGFLCGVTADIEIDVYSNPQAIVLERKNLLHQGGKDFVFLDDKGSARKVQVHVGRSNGLYVEINKGLKAGDKLIVEGQALLKDGKKIKIENS